MTDIKTIAAECATRIMDRMEMCRGSAILKSDIAREVESAIDEMMAELGLREEATQELVVYGASPAYNALTSGNLVERALKALNEQAHQAMKNGQWADTPEIYAEINKALSGPGWGFVRGGSEPPRVITPAEALEMFGDPAEDRSVDPPQVVQWSVWEHPSRW